MKFFEVNDLVGRHGKKVTVSHKIHVGGSWHVASHRDVEIVSYKQGHIVEPLCRTTRVDTDQLSRRCHKCVCDTVGWAWCGDST